MAGSTPTAGINDISISNNKGGALKSLIDSKSTYSITKYPLDLGTGSDVKHYVTFYINVPKGTKIVKDIIPGVQSASAQNFSTLGRSGSVVSGSQAGQAALAGGVGSGVAAGTKAILAGGLKNGAWKGAAKKAAAAGAGGALKSGGIGAGIAYAIDTQPKLDRIKEAISIYMPDTVLADYSHNYAQESMTEAAGQLGQQAVMAGGTVGALGTAANKLNPFSNEPSTLGPSSMEAGGIAAGKSGLVNGQLLTDFALKSVGASINPQVELMFKGTNNRDFIFNFNFVPKTAAEAASIRNIIRLFKLYAAPEFNAAQNGRYFINPAEFDIAFFFDGKENIYLNKISTCVLENVMVNYSPQQFTTFEDGMPAIISLQLRFKEADIMYRELIDTYGY
jgi:Tail-tube assembly protein